MIQGTTYKIFAERVLRRLQNDWPANTFTVTENEIYLYLFDAIGATISKIANDQYAIEGIHSAPEGFITTFKFNASALTLDADTGDYTLTLPHPPISIPNGILSPTFTGSGSKSYPLIKLEGYNKLYGFKLPTPSYGAYYQVEGNKLIITCPGVDIVNSGWKIQVPMVSSRSANGVDTDTINVPEDVLSTVFDIVIAKLMPRVQTPKDLINDGVDKKTDQ